jgi:hypothetical protein
MGNVISHKKISIEFDTWEPFKKQAEEDLDKLVGMVKTKELLKHCGNVHLFFEDTGEIK